MLFSGSPKMAFNVQEKSTNSDRIHRSRSITSTQRWVRRVMKKSPPSRNDILRWAYSFLERGNYAHKRGNRRPRTDQVTVGNVGDKFENDPKLSI